MAAYTKGNSDKENIDGIVCGHAYSVMEIRKPAGLMMIRLRNPWGNFEWTGKWSDTGDAWINELDGQVKRLLHFTANDQDGSFWMEVSSRISVEPDLGTRC